MKLKLFTAGAAASLLFLSACGGAPTAKSLEESGAKSMTDSLSYYEGLGAMSLYQQMTMSDSTLKTEKSKQELLDAFSKAIKEMSGKSDAELSGIVLAVQMIIHNKELKEDFGLTFNPTLMATGLAYGLKNDSTPDLTAASQYIQTTVTRLQKEMTDKNTKAAGKTLEALGKKGYTKIADNLYMKTLTPGQGETLNSGDRVKISMTAKEADGKALNLPMPEDAVVGQMFAGTPLGDAFSKLKIGEKAEFAVPTASMFMGPSQMKQLGVKPDGVLLFTIEVTGRSDAKTPGVSARQGATTATAPAAEKNAKAAPKAVEPAKAK